jgi:hypothetical protein
MSEDIFDSLSQLCQEGSWQVVVLALLVDDQEPNGRLIGIEVDHPGSTTLALACGGPPHLATNTAASNQVARLGVFGNPVDELVAFDIRPNQGRIALEDRCFGDSSHKLILRQSRSSDQASRCPLLGKGHGLRGRCFTIHGSMMVIDLCAPL